MESSNSFTDTSQCSTRPFLEDFWECRVERLKLLLHCPHALRFGDTHFCRHPDRSRFVRTEGREE
jgi:hypothetical protein